jgi:hypothetical protein
MKTTLGNKKPTPQLKYVIARGKDSGVHAGYLASRKGTECVLKKARRIWYWTGAATLSQLAQDGTSSPNTCKFPCEVDEIMKTDACEYLSVTETARKSIASVPEWKQ